MLRRRKKRPRPAEEDDDVEMPTSVPIYTTKRFRRTDEEDEWDPANTRKIESLVFGDEAGMISALAEQSSGSDRDEIPPESDESDDDQFTFDKTFCEREVAWVDESDAKASIDIASRHRTRKLRVNEEETTLDGAAFSQRLRSQFTKVYGDASWAQLPPVRTVGQASEEDTSGTDLLLRTGPLLANQTQHLPPDILDIRQLKDANCSDRSPAAIQSVEFHPRAPVVLTAGLHKRLDLFQINNEDNPQLHSIHMKHFPIHNAHFTPDGQQVVMTSRRPFFYVYDIMADKAIRIPGLRGRHEKSWEYFVVSPDNDWLVFTGQDGSLLLVSNKTKQLVDCFRMSGSAVTAVFTPDGSHLLSAGSDGMVYVWDMKSRSCCHTFNDEGSIHNTALAISPDSQHFACGNNTGIVNVYDKMCLSDTNPKPVKTITNLTTCCSSLTFNPSGEILAMTSRTVKKGIRLAHFPSMSVFSNWPRQKTPLTYVNVASFSPASDSMAIGDVKGRALIFRLNHFSKQHHGNSS